MDGGGGGRSRHRTGSVPEFNEKHLQRLQSKMMVRRNSAAAAAQQYVPGGNGEGGHRQGYMDTGIQRRVSQADNDLGNCWWRVSSVQSGDFQRNGLHTILGAGRQKSQYCAVYKPVGPDGLRKKMGSHYALQVQLKVVRLPGVDKHDICENAVSIMFSCRSLVNYCCLTLDVTSGGYWSLVQVVDGQRKVVSRVADVEGTMRHNVFYGVGVVVRGEKVSISCGGTKVFNEIPMGPLLVEDDENVYEDNDAAMGGDLGILCRGSRCVLKDWAVSDFNENGMKKFESKMTDAPDRAPPPTGQRYENPNDSRVVQQDPALAGLSADDRKFAMMIQEDIVDR